MTRNLFLFLLLLLACAAGCPASHLGPIEDMPSGIYRLEAEVLFDSCSTPSHSGAVEEVSVEVDSGNLTLTIPQSLQLPLALLPADERGDLGLLARLNLGQGDGYQVAWTRPDPWCSNSETATSYRVVSVDSQSIEVEYSSAWSISGECPAPPTPLPGPAADCSVRASLRYELVRACEAPCELLTDPGIYLRPTCVCP